MKKGFEILLLLLLLSFLPAGFCFSAPSGSYIQQIGTDAVSTANPVPSKVQVGVTPVDATHPLPGLLYWGSAPNLTSATNPLPSGLYYGTTAVGTANPLPTQPYTGANAVSATHPQPSYLYWGASPALVDTGTPLPTTCTVNETNAKGTTAALFGGAISASVAEADATVIDMTGYNGGSLDVLINSGTGTFSIVVMTSEANSGVFHQMYQEKSDKSGMEATPAIVTIASTSTSFSISGIRANYLKLVPTLTGTANVTFKFTPSKN